MLKDFKLWKVKPSPTWYNFNDHTKITKRLISYDYYKINQSIWHPRIKKNEKYTSFWCNFCSSWCATDFNYLKKWNVVYHMNLIWIGWLNQSTFFIVEWTPTIKDLVKCLTYDSLFLLRFSSFRCRFIWNFLFTYIRNQ